MGLRGGSHCGGVFQIRNVITICDHLFPLRLGELEREVARETPEIALDGLNERAGADAEQPARSPSSMTRWPRISSMRRVIRSSGTSARPGFRFIAIAFFYRMPLEATFCALKILPIGASRRRWYHTFISIVMLVSHPNTSTPFTHAMYLLFSRTCIPRRRRS